MPDSDSLIESIKNKSEELEGTKGSSNLLEDLELANLQIEELKECVRNLKQEVANSKSRFDDVSNVNQRLRENLKKKRKEVSELTEQLSVQSFEFIGTSKDLETTKQELQESQKKVDTG